MERREAAFDGLDEPRKRGDAAEAIIGSEFAVRDVPVLVPEYDNEPYDLVTEFDGSFHRVQCKTAYDDRPGTVRFETRSTRVEPAGYERESCRGADYFVVYHPRLGVVSSSTQTKHR